MVAMYVLMHDATDLATQRDGVNLANTHGVSDLMYAGDTLLVGVHASVLQVVMKAVGAVGREYGLVFH